MKDSKNSTTQSVQTLLTPSPSKASASGTLGLQRTLPWDLWGPHCPRVTLATTQVMSLLPATGHKERFRHFWWLPVANSCGSLQSLPVAPCTTTAGLDSTCSWSRPISSST